MMNHPRIPRSRTASAQWLFGLGLVVIGLLFIATGIALLFLPLTS